MTSHIGTAAPDPSSVVERIGEFAGTEITRMGNQNGVVVSRFPTSDHPGLLGERPFNPQRRSGTATDAE